MIRFVALLALMAAPVAAQEGLRFDPGVINACLADGKGSACIGHGMEACIADTPGGESTIGMAGCAEAEHRWWDGQLNEAYQARQAMAREIDRQPAYTSLPRPSDVEALRGMQRAWIAFRDATCAFEELQWWGGTGASGAGAICRMRLTGEQTLYLRGQMGG